MFFPLRSLRRIRLAALIALAAAPAVAHPVVVELYTSQGCSSCVPADALMAKLAERKDLLALSLPITYWDMLGWKDTLATKANTDRQKGYAQAMGRGGVYTPQIIVDGVQDVVGSREDAVEKAIAAHRADPSVAAASVALKPNEIQIVVEGGHAPADATVWLATVRPRAMVKIGGGENAGRTVTYRDVVVQIKAVGLWKGKALTLDLPREATAPDDGVAVIVQQNGYGPILGATPIAWPGR